MRGADRRLVVLFRCRGMDAVGVQPRSQVRLLLRLGRPGPHEEKQKSRSSIILPRTMAGCRSLLALLLLLVLAAGPADGRKLKGYDGGGVARFGGHGTFLRSF